MAIGWGKMSDDEHALHCTELIWTWWSKWWSELPSPFCTEVDPSPLSHSQRIIKW